MSLRFVASVLLALTRLSAIAHAAPLNVCATVPDLGSLVRRVGGPEVTVTVFAKATEDSHFVEPKPSFVVRLRDADLLVLVGLDLEVGWLPKLVETARNANILPGARGYVDASVAVDPIGAPAGPVDRSMGDVHPLGNPHYLTDPLNGLKVAALIRDKLTELRPGSRSVFGQRFADFRQHLGVAMVGEALATKYDFEKLAALFQYGRLDGFLDSQGESSLLGGWLALMRPHRGVKAVEDHSVWANFTRRFGIQLIARMEPLPGIPPTTKHLARVVELMRAEDVRLILTVAYYDPRHARFLADQTQAAVAYMANEVGARNGTDDYLHMSDYNVKQVVAALGGGA
jgi:ABC-type Zn uptake system ZnuABC Zn-binding protein ZnuA